MEDIGEVVVSWILKDKDRALDIKEQGFSISVKGLGDEPAGRGGGSPQTTRKEQDQPEWR